MKKLKDLLKESNVWDRKFGEKLPSLKDCEERYKQKLNEAGKHGFDLTDFKPGGFQQVLKGLGIPPKPGKFVKSRHGVSQWEWKGNGILIVTGNDPITGKYATPKRRPDEKNYASYIGIEGKSDLVAQAVDLIKKFGNSKGESRGQRGFI